MNGERLDACCSSRPHRRGFGAGAAVQKDSEEEVKHETTTDRCVPLIAACLAQGLLAHGGKQELFAALNTGEFDQLIVRVDAAIKVCRAEMEEDE